MGTKSRLQEVGKPEVVDFGKEVRMSVLPGNEQQQQQQQQQHGTCTCMDKPESNLTAFVATSSVPTTTTTTSPITTETLASDGLSLQICGKGELIVIFPTETGNGEKGQEAVGKISLSVETSIPVIVNVPTAKGFWGVDVQCRGSIDLHLETQGNDKEAHVKNASTKPDETEGHSEEDGHFSKSHRRNNSDYLLVSGETTNANDCAGTQNNAKTNVAAELYGSCLARSDPRSFDDNTAVKNVDTGDEDIIAEVRHVYSQPRNTGTRVNLNGPIRDNYTQLLQEIRLITLCDHLYQNQVVDMETYQCLYEGRRNGRTTQDGIRQLLMTLSCMTVKKVPFLKALLESDHKDIIPMLLPKVS